MRRCWRPDRGAILGWTGIQQINGVPRLHNDVVAQTLDLEDRPAIEVPPSDFTARVNFIRDRQWSIGRSDDKIINDGRRCIALSALVRRSLRPPKEIACLRAKKLSQNAF